MDRKRLLRNPLIWIVVFFLVYTFVFNWVFDRVFGLPASALNAPQGASQAA